MDRHNNELAIALGERARTWDEVKQGAQETMDKSDRNGSGVDGGAVWLPRSQWSNHPKNKAGNERPPSEWNWPNTDWIHGGVPNPVPDAYPYGGEEHRYEPAIDDPVPMALEPGAEVNPLSRPVASWSEDDLRRVMASPAYLQPSHPGRARAHAMVRDWFVQAETQRPAQVDATGRRVPEGAAAVVPAGDACGPGAVAQPPRRQDRGRGALSLATHRLTGIAGATRQPGW